MIRPLVTSLVLVAGAGLSLSQARTQAPTQESPTPYSAPVPAPDEFDWIQLVSGEWLKGELLRLRDGTLEFDSDKLDTLNLDWDDVLVVRSSRVQSVLFENHEVCAGTLLIQGGEVIVGGEGGRRFDRSELLAVLPGSGGESANWSGKLSLGLTMRRGNTSQTDLTAYAFARRETTGSRWDSSYNGAFSRTNSVETANNHRVSTQLDIFLTRRLYVTALTANAYRDPFQNIDLRATPAAGFGYDLVKRNTLSWEIGAGPAFQYTRFDSVQSGEPATDTSFAGYFSTGVEWDITPDAEIKLDYNITAPIPASHEYNHHLSTRLSLDLYGDIDLDLALIWDRVNRPPIDADGNLPKSDDLRLTVGFGFDF